MNKELNAAVDQCIHFNGELEIFMNDQNKKRSPKCMFTDLPKTIQTAIVENLISNEDESNLLRGKILAADMEDTSFLDNSVDSLCFTLNNNITLTDIGESNTPISKEHPIFFTELPVAIKKLFWENFYQIL